MADTTTELEVLDEIVDVLGGQSGQYETVVPTLQQILALLGGGGGGSGSGYNPSLSVGRADALTGADSTAQWAQRESTGSGAATVRSVQGAAVAWAQLAKVIEGQRTSGGVTIDRSADGTVTVFGTAASFVYLHLADANYVPPIVQGHKYLVRGPEQGGNLTVHIPGGVGFNSAYDGQIITALGNASASSNIYIYVMAGFDGTATFKVQLFDLTVLYGAGNEPATVSEFETMYPEPYYPYSAPTLKPVQIAGIASTDAQGGDLDSIEWTAQTLRAAGSVADVLYSDHADVNVGERAYQSGDESDATVRTDGTTTYYPLTTPTTQPISPALPMTYRVEQGGTESIIVPDGEVSAAPVLTIAEGESAGELVMDALACIATPDGPVATSSHAVNTYLTMQGKLYKVTSAIAVGETIKSGTNVSQTTVMAELIARTA